MCSQYIIIIIILLILLHIFIVVLSTQQDTPQPKITPRGRISVCYIKKNTHTHNIHHREAVTHSLQRIKATVQMDTLTCMKSLFGTNKSYLCRYYSMPVTLGTHRMSSCCDVHRHRHPSYVRGLPSTHIIDFDPRDSPDCVLRSVEKISAEEWLCCCCFLCTARGQTQPLDCSSFNKTAARFPQNKPKQSRHRLQPCDAKDVM